MLIKHLSLAASFAVVLFSLACASEKPAPAPPGEPGPSSQPATSAGTSEEEEHERHEAEMAKGRDQVDADGVVRRGNPLTASLEATPVSVAVAKAKDLDGKTVKLTGKVADVCSKMGCWFVVQGEKPEDRIRISTKAHNIFVPHSAIGMTAIVEGTLTTKTLDKETAEHLGGESSGKKPAAGDVEIRIDVVGLEMKKT